MSKTKSHILIPYTHETLCGAPSHYLNTVPNAASCKGCITKYGKFKHLLKSTFVEDLVSGLDYHERGVKMLNAFKEAGWYKL